MKQKWSNIDYANTGTINKESFINVFFIYLQYLNSLGDYKIKENDKRHIDRLISLLDPLKTNVIRKEKIIALFKRICINIINYR